MTVVITVRLEVCAVAEELAGFIGLGVMGQPMALRLAGFEPATRCLEDAAQLSDVVCYLGK